ncbi:MAG: YicC family protein [Oscillospiraceae bacterium]|nr:YicC family protein [Oscillospiraceae bacterium]
MTGYGTAKGKIEDLDVTIELKSVNNRYLDTSVRVPRGFVFLEDKIKSTIQSKLSRGKIDVFVTIDSSSSEDLIVRINEPLARGYIEALKSLSEEFELSNNVDAVTISRFPDVLSLEKKEMDMDAVSAGIQELTLAAVADFDRMRAIEGEKLQLDLYEKISCIESLLGKIEEEAPKTVEEYQNRLLQKMKDVLEDSSVDENRIIQEAAIYADHIAINEETVRLHSHIAQLKMMIEQGSPIGRKMDFLIQEFNREANTIGSKCQNSEVAHYVVDMKSEIEKMREQVQNIE